MKYVLNTNTNKLHIEGCRHIYSVLGDNYRLFDSENEARRYNGNAIGFCVDCNKRIEEILKRK